LEEAVGFDIVETGGLPEKHHILLVGINLLVDALVIGGEKEANGTALGEITSEERVKLVKELFAKVRKVFDGLLDFLEKLILHDFFKVGGLYAH